MDNTDPREKYAYTYGEAALRSGVSRSKLYEAARSGQLKVKKIGRNSRILDEDLRQYLRELPYAEAV